jgi:hypothetical protein
MRIYKEVLSDSLIEECKDDISNLINQNVWRSNVFNWDSNLLKGTSGTCIYTKISNEKILNQLIEQTEEHFIKKYKTLTYLYYIWQSNSGISLHTDEGHAFGATIYLNDEWHLHDGGIFLWKDGDCPNEVYKAICPQENMMIINDNYEKHMVTLVSPNSNDYRYTIQIWGDVR